MRFTKAVITVDRHEYRIKGPNIYGKDLDDAIQAARNDMETLDMRSDFDDSVNVRPEDDDIVVWFQIKTPKDPGIGHVTRAGAWDQGYAAAQRDAQHEPQVTANPWRTQ